MRHDRAAAPARWILAAVLALTGIWLSIPTPGWSQPTFSPATQIYKVPIYFSPGSSRLSQKSVGVLRDVVKRAEHVQLPRVRVTVDGGDEVWHSTSVRLRKSQGDAIVKALQRAGLKEIPIDVEGVAPNQPGTVPPGRRARAVRRKTTVSIWDIRGG